MSGMSLLYYTKNSSFLSSMLYIFVKSMLVRWGFKASLSPNLSRQGKFDDLRYSTWSILLN